MWHWKMLHRSFFPSFTDELGKAVRHALDGVSAALLSAWDSVTATTFPRQQRRRLLETGIFSRNQEVLTVEGSHSLPSTQYSCVPPLRLSLSPLQAGAIPVLLQFISIHILGALPFKSTKMRERNQQGEIK